MIFAISTTGLRRQPAASRTAALLFVVCASLVGLLSSNTVSAAPKSVAFLGVQLQNDNETFEPTSDAERARMAAIGDQFTDLLQASGDYEFLPVPPEFKAKIDAGSPLTECGGCEIAYGKELGADTIAWVKVQKVSNLILNMNVYMADVPSERMLFLHSADMRGNTDESWNRAMRYIVKNYLLVPASGG